MCGVHRRLGSVLPRLLGLLVVVSAALPAASLFKAETLQEGNLYNDQVARQIGDLITIRVSETTAVNETARTTRTRESSADAGVRMLPGSNRLPPAVGSGASDRLPGLAYEAEKEFSGEGSMEQRGSFSTTVTGRVVDVLDNGNLLVQARRSIRVGKDVKTILLTGICRTSDINADNIIMSEKLHGFQVSLEGQGPLNRSQQQGWLSRLLDVIWPL